MKFFQALNGDIVNLLHVVTIDWEHNEELNTYFSYINFSYTQFDRIDFLDIPKSLTIKEKEYILDGEHANYLNLVALRTIINHENPFVDYMNYSDHAFKMLIKHISSSQQC